MQLEPWQAANDPSERGQTKLCIQEQQTVATNKCVKAGGPETSQKPTFFTFQAPHVTLPKGLAVLGEPGSTARTHRPTPTAMRTLRTRQHLYEHLFESVAVEASPFPSNKPLRQSEQDSKRLGLPTPCKIKHA